MYDIEKNVAEKSININMGCIETYAELFKKDSIDKININMGCIETVLNLGWDNSKNR